MYALNHQSFLQGGTTIFVGCGQTCLDSQSNCKTEISSKGFNELPWFFCINFFIYAKNQGNPWRPEGLITPIVRPYPPFVFLLPARLPDPPSPSITYQIFYSQNKRNNNAGAKSWHTSAVTGLENISFNFWQLSKS